MNHEEEDTLSLLMALDNALYYAEDQYLIASMRREEYPHKSSFKKKALEAWANFTELVEIATSLYNNSCFRCYIDADSFPYITAAAVKGDSWKY